jgi:hypothetical protein
MTVWVMLLYVFLAGVIGGIANALMTDNGFALPKSENTITGTKILRPGFLGNMLIGGVAAALSWGIYGPLANLPIAITGANPSATATSAQVGLYLSSLAGALLIGVGGARWLTSEVDKKLLTAAAVKAASSTPNAAAATKIAAATPAYALELANKMQ